MLLCRKALGKRSGFRTVVVTSFVLVLNLMLIPRADAALQFRYTSLGDSIAFGIWALPSQGYPFRYMRHLEADTGVELQIIPLGVPGWTSSDLVNALRQGGWFRFATFISEVVTFNIGGNDLRAARSAYKAQVCGDADNQQCLRAGVAAFKANWDGIIQEIKSLRSGRPTIIRTMDIYNPFVTVDQASDSWPGDGMNDFQALNPYLSEVNAHIAASSAANGILVAPIHLTFNGASGAEDPAAKGYISFDGFHPNGLGHRVMGQLLRGLGYAVTVP